MDTCTSEACVVLTKSQRKNRNRRNRRAVATLHREGQPQPPVNPPAVNEPQPNLGIHHIRCINRSCSTKNNASVPCSLCGWFLYCCIQCRQHQDNNYLHQHDMMVSGRMLHLTCAQVKSFNQCNWKTIKDAQATVMVDEPGNATMYNDMVLCTTTVLSRMYLLRLNIIPKDVSDYFDEKVVSVTKPGSDVMFLNVVLDYLRCHHSPCVAGIIFGSGEQKDSIMMSSLQGPLSQCARCSKITTLVECQVCKMVDSCANCKHIEQVCRFTLSLWSQIMSQVMYVPCDPDIVRASVSMQK